MAGPGARPSVSVLGRETCQRRRRFDAEACRLQLRDFSMDFEIGSKYSFMIEDVLFKLGRKSLPRGIYKGISRSVFGREKAWKKLGTYEGIFALYKAWCPDLSGKTVLEIGCGDQFFTAYFFLSAGAKQVLLVEPTLRLDREKAREEWREFCKDRAPSISFEEAMHRILCYGDLSEIPEKWNEGIEDAFSHLVLEHFRDLKPFFGHTRRLLAQGGRSHNIVDLSDHTYHVFHKYSFLRNRARRRQLFHLRYSEKAFNRLNDPKCYMNRILLPEYLELADRNGLKVEELKKDVDASALVHPDLVRKYDGHELPELQVVSFKICLGREN